VDPIRGANRSASLVLVGLIVGACVFGVIGAIVGLTVGLVVYPPTAWAAMIEVGFPATVLGCLIGVGVGAILNAFRARADRSDPPRPH
jgi:hypothetical protein